MFVEVEAVLVFDGLGGAILQQYVDDFVATGQDGCKKK
jgi:hypothetical protein